MGLKEESVQGVGFKSFEVHADRDVAARVTGVDEPEFDGLGGGRHGEPASRFNSVSWSG